MKKLAISIGDINGIGLEIALRSHELIKEFCIPIYCINKNMLTWGAAWLGLDVPYDFTCKECGDVFDIKPGISNKEAGQLSYDSFTTAITLAQKKEVEGIVTLPINKESWSKAGIKYKGHTDALSDLLDSNAIMMLGCEEMFTILYTHHIPLKSVSETLDTHKLKKFLIKIYESLHVDKIAVLGFNPHAGDGGVIGDEDFVIKKAIKKANKKLDKKVFIGPLVPDTAFTKANREKYKYFACMYHDQGLIPLKALYFDESINVSLDAGIIRTSVDHGTAFDIAYEDAHPSCKSYINAIQEAVKLSLRK
ncbi:4-hydroxythreonine-4-phosphate dehydrogenase [Sulfurospirillum arcachonense]|uniref:4-hydroxythreonine-4-phosphate dehydrogenase n=1 Tax=Sulfurospirillum arcachonense TaxID=57666 RepID=UPI0004694F85|nr:4-hydroxythreonine-4-phosphate dehydrogenase [Sulfurospirillum arcachonense]